MPVTAEDVPRGGARPAARVRGVGPRAPEGPGGADRLRLRVPDDTLLGFGFPREERAALVASEPDKFQLPRPSDMRYQWVVARMPALEFDEMRELVTDAWAMCVPKSVRERYFESR